MIYQTYQPRSPLSQFVEVLWMREGDNLPQTQSCLLPIGSMELVINLHEDSIPLFDRESRSALLCQRQSKIGNTNGSMLCGAHSQGFIINNDSKISMMGVHFKADGSVPFFKLPAGELHNQRISLTQLWQGRSIELRDSPKERLRQRLLAASTWAARFLVLEKFLLMVMQPPDRYNAVDFALREFVRSPTSTVSEVTDKIGYSARHFNQIFRNRVGLTPKLFCRIRRLQQVLDLLSGKDLVDWADIAITCGYFDQAHFIHDFRMFANCTPTEYLAQRGFHPCHVVLLD
jgi:AraC-like DNA-binding protein